MPLSTTIPIPPFPLYLLPPIPFRRLHRRRSSATTTSTTSSPSSSPPNPSTFLPAIVPPSHLRCAKCLTDLIPVSSIISKGFTGRHGRAYLVSPPPPNALYPYNTHSTHDSIDDFLPGDIPNVATLKPVPRQLVTGAHTVSDVSCKVCGTVLGWKYVDAEEDAPKYKVGKFILETKRVVQGAGWEGEDGREDTNAIEEEGGVVAGGSSRRGKGIEGDIEFDSQDEDECEDLFAGVWSPGLARRRRRNKIAKGL